MTTPNTPEKSTTGGKCPHCGSLYSGGEKWDCGSGIRTGSGQYRTPFCIALEAKNRAVATIQERDQTIKTQNLLAREEAKILQRWKEFGIEEERKRKTSEAELAEVKAQIEINSISEICKSCGKTESPSLTEGGECIFCITKNTQTQNAKLKGLLESQIKWLKSRNYPNQAFQLEINIEPEGLK